MKLKNIKIEELFGLEQNNFDIDLYPNEKVTLLYGFNGVGKTSIIKLINAAVSCELVTLFEMKFKKVRITFEDNSKLGIIRDSDLAARILRLKARKESIDTYHPFSFTLIDSNGNENIYKFRLVGSEKRIALDYFYPQCLDDESQIRIRELQDILSKKINLHTIFANRDFNRVFNPELFGDRIRFNEENPNKKIICCSKREAWSIYSYLKQQFEDDEKKNQKQLDDNVNLSYSSVPEYHYFAEIPDKLDEINDKIKNLLKSGRDSFNEHINLFNLIINEEFGLLYKNVELSVKGLSLKNTYDGDAPVEISMLSSGEKNIICLFLELIFFSNENSVFFIDEPEVSLHIDWQAKIVKNILSVCEYKSLQVIIATHSPSIIDEYWGLMSEVRSTRFDYDKYF